MTDYRETFHIHPVSRLVNAYEETSFDLYERAWRDLGFEISMVSHETPNDSWDRKAPFCNSMWNNPPVTEGWHRTDAWSDEDGNEWFVEVRPESDFATQLLQLCERHGFPELAGVEA